MERREERNLQPNRSNAGGGVSGRGGGGWLVRRMLGLGSVFPVWINPQSIFGAVRGQRWFITDDGDLEITQPPPHARTGCHFYGRLSLAPDAFPSRPVLGSRREAAVACGAAAPDQASSS